MTTKTKLPIQLGDPIEHCGIVVAPLFPRSDPRAQYLTLDQAVALGFTVTEVDAAGSVPELLAHNPLDASVLLYDGEELIGAKQNRILNVTVLVTAASETVADDMPFLVDSISRTGSGGTRPGLTALEERIGSAAVAAHDPTVWETVDPDGRIVALDFRGWRHISETHRELQVERQVILDAVSKPDRRSPGHDPGEEWFYRRGFGPSQWIKVVVHYEDERGLIVAAFPRRSFP